MSVIDCVGNDQQCLTYDVYHFSNYPTQPFNFNFGIDDRSMHFQVDTSAAITITSETAMQQHWRNLPTLHPVNTKLRTYTGENINILGNIYICRCRT